MGFGYDPYNLQGHTLKNTYECRQKKHRKTTAKGHFTHSSANQIIFFLGLQVRSTLICFQACLCPLPHTCVFSASFFEENQTLRPEVLLWWNFWGRKIHTAPTVFPVVCMAFSRILNPHMVLNFFISFVRHFLWTSSQKCQYLSFTTTTKKCGVSQPHKKQSQLHIGPGAHRGPPNRFRYEGS